MARLRPDVAELVARAAATPLVIDLNAPDVARAQHAASSRLSDLPRDPSTRVEDLSIPGPGGTLPLRLYTPGHGAASNGVVLFLHGGGWLLGDLDTHDGLCGAICEGLAMRVLAVDYRRAPEHKFPAALDDCRTALAWLARSPDELGAPVEGLVLAGDSAGGNMAASLALQPPPTASLLALWTMYASFDMDAEGGSMDAFEHGHLLTGEMLRLFRQAYFAPGQDRRSPLASPLYADPAGAPPSLVFANECDPLRDQSRAFAAGLARAGRPVRYREARGHVHGSLCRRASAPSGRADLAGCLDDLKSLIAEAQRTQA